MHSRRDIRRNPRTAPQRSSGSEVQRATIPPTTLQLRAPQCLTFGGTVRPDQSTRPQQSMISDLHRLAAACAIACRRSDDPNAPVRSSSAESGSSRMMGSDGQCGVRGYARGTGQCVEPRYRDVQRAATSADVEGRARRRGAGHVASMCCHSPSSSAVRCVITPRGGRGFEWTRSTGTSSSIHLAPSIDAAARPATTALRPDHNQAAMMRRSAWPERHTASRRREGRPGDGF